MPKKSVELSNHEYKLAEQKKRRLGLTDREIFLKALGIEPEKRPLGRPKKRSLRFLGVYEVLANDEQEDSKWGYG